MIRLKNDEVIDFLTSPPSDFSASKYVQAEMLFRLQKPVTRLLPMTSVTFFRATAVPAGTAESAY